MCLIKNWVTLRNVSIFLVFLIQGALSQTMDMCEKQLDALLMGIDKQEPWAVIMYDSWGTRPSGIYSGNMIDYGNFDQCYNFVHNHPSLGQIQGQNCIVPVQTKNAMALTIPGYRMSICVPSTCSPKEIRNLLQLYFSSQGLFVAEYNPINTCEVKSPVNYSPSFWIGVTFFIVFLTLITTSTIYDAIIRYLAINSKAIIKPRASLISFSLYTNMMQVFNYADNRKQQIILQGMAATPSTTFTSLNCLNGLRVLSTLWVIYQHTYYMQLSFPLINENYKYQWAQQWFSMIYISARVAVDNFLLISGTLIAWNFLSERKRGTPYNILKSYIIRYVRLTSALVPAILFTIGPLTYTANGPEWTARTSEIVGFCEKYWWSALLHIQNYVNPFEVCVGQAWYLSVDFQLYLFSPLILYPLWKYGNKFLWIIMGLILLILTYILIICIYKEIYISWFLRDTPDLYRYLYGQTHVKAMPWLMGIILGYVLFQTKDKCVVLSKKIYLTAWIFTILIIMAIIYAPMPLQTPHITDQTKAVTVAYQTLHTFGWTLATAWIIFACCHNYDFGPGFINHFLAHPFWLPLARIAFSVYLVHLPFQYVMIASKKISGHFSDTSTLHAFCGDVGFAILIGLVWHLMFECPFNVLTKDCLKQKETEKNDVQKRGTLNEIVAK